MRNLTLLPWVGLLLWYASPTQAQMAQTQALLSAEQMPFFEGCADTTFLSEQKRRCSNQSLVHFIKDNLIYPETAKSAGIEGTVIVKFIVDEFGYLSSPQIVKNIGGGCGEAAVNVLHRMPKWEPAMDNGGYVKVELTLPIHFSLANETINISENYKLAWGNIHANQVTKAQLIQNLKETLYVRDELGNDLLIDELVFSFSKKNKQLVAKSRGEINKELSKIIEKAKKGGELNIRASVQDNGHFFYVGKTFVVVEN